MTAAAQKKSRMLEIFYRAMRGESISVGKMADEYEVSVKSISRDIAEINNFLSENRELVGNVELKYAANSKTYYLEFDNFLLSKELFAVIKILIGCRGLQKMELLQIIEKLKCFTTQHDKELLTRLIEKEMYHYNQVNHDCKSVIDYLWQLTRCIDEKKELTVTYYKANRREVERKLCPIAIIFSEYYYYLIAYRSDSEERIPLYYRIDRITKIIEHRTRFTLDHKNRFDEGELKNKIQFMFPGEHRKIRFSYSGVSVQAILDKIPTARVIDVKGNTKIIEAETFGTGINMFLLSQGSMVKALAPESFVREMKEEIEKMMGYYTTD